MLSRLAGAQAPRVLAPSLLRPRILRLAGVDRGFKTLLRAFSDAKPVEDAPTRDLREEKYPVAKEYWNDVSRDADLWPGMESKQLVRARAELEAGATQYAFGLHPDAGLLGNSGLVSKYGRYTMLTAAGLILVGNEFLLLNSELLHVIPHYIILLLLWAKAAPMIQETVTARRNKRLKWWNDLYDSSVHNQRLLLARVRRQYDFPKLMTKMLDDTRAVSQQAAAALLYTARQRHAAQLTGMLQAAAHMEKQQLEDLQADYIDTAAKFVMYSYAYPTTKEKSMLLKLSLLRVLGFGRRELPNPLTEQFGKYSKYYSAVVAEFKKQSTSPPYRPRLTGESAHTSNIEVCALIQQRFSAPDTVWFYDYIPQVHIFLASAMLTELNQRAPRAEILAVVDREIAGLPEAIRAEARQQLLAGVEGDTSAAANTSSASKPKAKK